MRNYLFVLAVIGFSFITASCSNAQLANTDTQPGVDQSRAQSPAPSTAQASAQATPSKKFTAADVAKLKWLVGSYRGTGADKPFFNRYRLDGTTLKVQGFEDEAMTKQVQAADYELIDGMFANPSGDHRFAASEITDDHVQFVTLTDGTAAYRLEKSDGGKVKATLESTGPDGKPTRTSYTLEPLK